MEANFFSDVAGSAQKLKRGTIKVSWLIVCHENTFHFLHNASVLIRS